jgi:release factor glutamine methyltransferase
MQTKLHSLPAHKVLENVDNRDSSYSSEVEGITLSIHPRVYPSEKFRTTSFVLNSMRDCFRKKVFCDMGCGPGIMGLYALKHGAARVVQADINPYAIQNAKDNNSQNGYDSQQITTYLSDCFDSVPQEKFDIIAFNVPFHNDEVDTSNPLSRAFYDPGFMSVRRFLEQATSYSHEGTEIYIAFSNKGDTRLLEEIFSSSKFSWELWKVVNQNEEYDNRIYKLYYS